MALDQSGCGLARGSRGRALVHDPRPGSATPAASGPSIRLSTRARYLCVLALSLPPGAHAQTAFRFSDLDLRDPHVFVNFLGCRDLTDTPVVGFSVNGELQTRIQTDGSQPSDGLLDLSYLVEFLPLDQAQPTNLVDTLSLQCTAPLVGTTCGPPATPLGIAGDASLASTGQCLAPLPGTTRPYSPAITNTSGPCFATPAGTVTLDLGGIPLTLRDTRIAATLVGNPAGNLVNGLLSGFVSEADANATILPATLPLIGGQTLSSLLPGGTGNCAGFNDKDINGGVQGWWFYLNFTAPRVTLVADPFADGFADGFE